MDDELELKVGQIVRVLHEYDDGWVSRSFLDKHDQYANSPRLSVPVWTALSKVLLLEPVSQNSL